MLDTIGGIPLHPLIVHAVVVLVPLASLLLLLGRGVAADPALGRHPHAHHGDPRTGPGAARHPER